MILVMAKNHSLRGAAQILGVHYTTLRRWVQLGTGPRTFVKRNSKRSTYRITADNLQAFQEKNSRGSQ